MATTFVFAVFQGLFFASIFMFLSMFVYSLNKSKWKDQYNNSCSKWISSSYYNTGEVDPRACVKLSKRLRSMAILILLYFYYHGLEYVDEAHVSSAAVFLSTVVFILLMILIYSYKSNNIIIVGRYTNAIIRLGYEESTLPLERQALLTMILVNAVFLTVTVFHILVLRR